VPLDRRKVILGLSSLAIGSLPLTAVAAEGRRELSLFFGDSRIGGQSIAVARQGDVLDVTLDLEVAVRVFGLTMYRYRLEARESWDDGRLVALEARTDDNGTARFARARRAGDQLVIEGSAFSGRVSGNPGTTSYWNPALLERGIWVSLEDGRPRRVSARPLGTETWQTAQGALAARRWRVEGEIDPIDLLYDEAGEWVGNEFTARGQRARFVLARRGPALTALWREA
jgi:hypothetical protein